ncbi:purple acid phosphatase 3 [Aspergillus lentulus]|nr:purple acid phosphatase 3 [Aspergillus lentulus]
MSRVALTLGLALGASAAKNSIVAPTGAETLTVALLGDYGWTGWQPLPLDFCKNVMPKLKADGVQIPREIQNDCDPGDRQAISNATIEEESTARYIENVCLLKNCSAFISVGDNFYDSGVDFTSEGIQRFYEGWANMYVGEAFNGKPWYQALGNHDVVAGKAGVDFQTRIAPLMEDRWYFGHDNLPYYTYDLTGSNWTATFVVVDSDCFINAYQDATSVYNTDYVISCHKDTQKQVDFLRKSFAESDATWKILQIHHGYVSSSSNYTELAPLIDIVRENNGVVVNGHDHCMAHYHYQGMDFVLTGGAGYAEAGDCNYGVPLGPYAKWLGADAEQAANGFVTLDISYNSLNFEYYARDMLLKGADYYSVKNDQAPAYSFSVTKHATKSSNGHSRT